VTSEDRRTALREATYALAAANLLYDADVEDMTEAVLQVAGQFEAWLLRQAEESPASPPAPRGERATDRAEAEAKADVAASRLPCGAFKRPAWYSDELQRLAPWHECSGEHRDDGWHRSTDDVPVTFHSHHMVEGPHGRPMCSCGYLGWPHEGLQLTDMTA
jgi:hypothetical protein